MSHLQPAGTGESLVAMADKQQRRSTPSDGGGGERPAKKVKFSPQVSISEFLAIPAKEAVTFHLLYGSSAAELEAEVQAGGVPFSCEYYNQVFGEGEEINGYKGLEVNVWIALRSGHCWVDVSFQESKPGADDVVGLLSAWWPKAFTTDKAEFLQAASSASTPDWSTLGPPLPDSIARGVGVRQGALQLYHATLADTPDWFKELHARLEPLLIFTIDGANFIDAADPKWEVVAAVVQRDGHSYMAGFMTLYNFYAWPMNKRPRVAQVLVLPTLQRCGYGRALVAAAYHLARERDAIDLTFEDPVEGLQLLREKLELEMMDACDWVTQPAHDALRQAAAQEQQLQDEARRLWSSGGRHPPQQQQQQQQQRSAAAAAAAAAPAAPQQNGHPPPSAAASPEAAAAAGAVSAGGVPGKSNAGSNGVPAATVKSPASCLVLPHALQQRVTKELKIHKHQVHAVWEALLFLHSPMRSDPLSSGGGGVPAAAAVVGSDLLLEPLTELVTSRLERGAAAAADKAAATKKMVKVEGTPEDWFVYKLPRRLQAARQQGAEQELAETVNVGRHNITKVSADDYSERLQEQVSQRLETLALIKRRVAARRRQQAAAAAAAVKPAAAAAGTT